MAVWLANLRALLEHKEVVILHGNVRDSVYLVDGRPVEGFSALLLGLGQEQGFERMIEWGVTLDRERGVAVSPLWSATRHWTLSASGPGKPEIQTLKSVEPPVVPTLMQWLQGPATSREARCLIVVHYADKLAAYSERGEYTPDQVQAVTLIQKLIENIAPNNRLILVALRDTLLPPEYYTNAPRVGLIEIPQPDREERQAYLERQVGTRMRAEFLDALANLTDGLYMRDLANVVRDVVRVHGGGGEPSLFELRRIVNRYRLGTENDPWEHLPIQGPPKGLIDSAEAWFRERVIGQDHAVAEVVRALLKARAGVVGLASGQEAKPRAVFFFAGPTGVGKTFLAKKLAEYLFDTEEAFIRFDMSEYQQEHAVDKMIGSPPGYVGHERGGQLTNAVRQRPFSVILFDEIEKAHPRILDIFLQILEDGRLTDGRGQTVFFTESVIIFTSNIGTRSRDSRGHECGERARYEAILQTTEPGERAARLCEHFVQAVRDFFRDEISRPELLNRFGSSIIAFNQMDRDDAQRTMIESKLGDIRRNFNDRFARQGFSLDYDPTVVDYFYENHRGAIGRFGGRGIVNAIEEEIGHLLARHVLLAQQQGLSSMRLRLFVEGGRVLCERQAASGS